MTNTENFNDFGICRDAGVCGGCTHQGVEYCEQLAMKEAEVRQLFEEGEITPDRFDSIEGCALEHRFRYRNKMEYTFGDLVKDGPMTLGMHKVKNFLSIVTVDECQIVDEDFNRILRGTLDFCTERGYSQFHKRKHVGLMRYLIVRKGIRTGELLVNIVTSGEDGFDEEGYLAAIKALSLDNELVGVLRTVNLGVADKVSCDELHVLFGRDYYMVNPETIYLNHIITCAQQGIFKGLDNKTLKELGAKIKFYDGIPDIFDKLKKVIADNDKYAKFGIHVEHYIVSTGLTQMIRGSMVDKYVDGIWGCEFIEEPVQSDMAEHIQYSDKIISQTGYIVDNTSKTRALFEINKGANKFEYINVNSKIEANDRRVPFSSMIYIADGPSDVPAFSILNQHGGHTFAIYPKGDHKAWKQVDALRRDDRINMYAEADYSEGTTANMWLTGTAIAIAEEIYAACDAEMRDKVKDPPKHLNTEDK